MTPQERQLVDDLFDRLSEGGERAARSGRRRRHRAGPAQGAQCRLRAGADRAGSGRSAEARQQPHPGTGGRRRAANNINPAASSIRCATRCSGRTSRAARCRMSGRRRSPAARSGTAARCCSRRSRREHDQGPGQHDQGRTVSPTARRRRPMGGGGSFLGTAAAAAAGMVGGSLLLGSIRSMMGGSHHGFGDTAGLGDKAGSQSPWSDQSGSDLARDAGINDIGSSAGRADDGSRAGLFDTASNDRRRSRRHGSGFRRFRRRRRQRLRLIDFAVQSKTAARIGRPFWFSAKFG